MRRADPNARECKICHRDRARARNQVVNSLTTSMERYDDNMVGGGGHLIMDEAQENPAPYCPGCGQVDGWCGCTVPALGANSSGNGVHTNTVVRRLTELECERLQGYPDNWTAGQSGAARYRQLGNSVAVPCVEWIARRLVAVDEELT